MDKRLSIALLLTAIVVAVTPILFPTPRKASTAISSPQSGTSPVSSTAPVQTVPAGAPRVAGSPAGYVEASKATPAGKADSSAATATAPVQVQTTAIVTTKAVYRFSNAGANLVSATMRGYKNLATKKGEVELHLQSQPLVSFALVL